MRLDFSRRQIELPVYHPSSMLLIHEECAFGMSYALSHSFENATVRKINLKKE